MNRSELSRLRGIEECIRYYPPDIVPLDDPGPVFQNHREVAVYLHVPFCRTSCGFCPFNQYPYKEDQVQLYLAALKSEIRSLRARQDLSQLKVQSVWIGGGTPTDLADESLAVVLALLHTSFDLSRVREFTVEARPVPSVLTPGKLAVLKAGRASRISIGLQSASDKFLHILGRGHGIGEARQAISAVLDLGFELNADMIYRLPEQTLAEVEEELDAVCSLGIDHLSWFPYVAHPGTRLSARLGPGTLGRTAAKAQYFDMFRTLCRRMAEGGYHQYTPYYFTRSHRSQYHIDRWQMPQRETLGLGAGAFSFFNGWIYANAHNVDHYVQIASSGRLPVVMGKRLSPSELATRLAVLGCKFFSIDRELFQSLTGVPLDAQYPTEIPRLVDLGLLVAREGSIECTELGRAFNNDVAFEFSLQAARECRQPQGLDIIAKGL